MNCKWRHFFPRGFLVVGEGGGYQLHTYELSTTIQCYTIIQLVQLQYSEQE